MKKQLLSDGKHIKLTLKCDNVLIDAIGFSMGDYSCIISEGNCIDVAGNLDINSYRGIDSPQIIIRDIKRIRQK